MIDMFGNVLGVDDIVVYNWKYSKYSSKYVKCKIIDFTNQKVYIEFITNDITNGTQMLVRTDKLIKAPIPECKPSMINKMKNAIQESIEGIGKKFVTLP